MPAAHQHARRVRHTRTTDNTTTGTAADPADNLPPPTRHDIYATVTAQIIAALQAGQTTFIFPWHRTGGPARNIVTGKPYRGINRVLLWLRAADDGYAHPHWGTFQQWRARGTPVRQGEKSTTIVFWQRRGDPADASSSSSPRPATTRTAPDRTPPSSPDTTTRPQVIARAYHVFNAAQVDGAEIFLAPHLPASARDAQADAFFSALPLTVRHGSDHAGYHPTNDTILLPDFHQFRDAAAYYGVRGHESVHATGARHRLDRDLTGRYGTPAYAAEELIAELGAAFLCADLGLAAEPRPDHAGYLATWLQLLTDNPRAIFTAASHAQAAVDWLHAQQPTSADDDARTVATTVAATASSPSTAPRPG